MSHAGRRRINTRVYSPTLGEFTDTFPDKIQDSQYSDDETSFRYWIDDCSDVVQADVTVTFTGDDAATMLRIDLPISLRYSYTLYDVGEAITFPVPEAGPPDKIPRPE